MDAALRLRFRRFRSRADRAGRLLTDGGEANGGDEEGESDDEEGSNDGDEGTTHAGALNRSNVEVTRTGEIDPADPKWEKPDPDEIPEVEGPKTAPAKESASGQSTSDADPASGTDTTPEDPTAGRPNTARSPGTSRIDEEETDAYVLAVELCARLPDDVRLPDEAADLVPVALEAELEREVQTFAAQEFGNQQPHVSELSFTDIDDEIWLRLRIGAPPEALDDLEEWTDDIEMYALQKLDSLL